MHAKANAIHDNGNGTVELFTRRWTEYDAPVLPRDYDELLLIPSLANLFSGAKDLVMEAGVGVEVSVLRLVIYETGGEPRDC